MSIGYALRGLTILCLSEPYDIDTARMGMRLPGDVYDRRTVLLATLNTYESRAPDTFFPLEG